MRDMIRRLMVDEDGQSMVEYGLIIALIAIVVIGALTLLGEGIQDVFHDVIETFEGR